jgi:PE-PPE domain
MRVAIRSTMRSAATAILVVLSAIVLAVSSTFTAALTLTGATALIVPGTGTPNPGNVGGYEQNALDYYISTTTSICQVNTCDTEGVPYIAQFWPFPFPGWGGLSGAKWNVSVGSGVAQLTSDLIGTYNPSLTDPIVVFGYSQGATVASLVKRNLGQLSDADKQNIAFVLIGNPNRPNGGIFERLALLGTVPILDATFGQPTPTGTGIQTTDIAFQYDGVADFPTYPINILADLNAIAGFWYIHGTYLGPNQKNPSNPNGIDPTDLETMVNDIVTNCATDSRCQQYGDTTYVTIPTEHLPLLQPFRDLGAATHLQFLTTPLTDLVEPALKVLIETGYDRSSYGTPTPFRLIPIVNPITFTVNFIAAVGQGIQDALADIGVPTSSLPSPFSVPNNSQQNSVNAPEPSVLSVSNADSAAPVVQDNNVTPISKGKKSQITADLGSPDQKLASVTDLPTITSVTKPQRPQVRGPISATPDAVSDAGDQLKQTIENSLPKPKVHPHSTRTTHAPSEGHTSNTNTSDTNKSDNDAAA